MGEVCRQWLDSPGRPEVAGERPHVSVLVDLEALLGGPARCELQDVGPITPATARRLVCDAGVSRVITRGRSEPLEVGLWADGARRDCRTWRFYADPIIERSTNTGSRWRSRTVGRCSDGRVAR